MIDRPEMSEEMFGKYPLPEVLYNEIVANGDDPNHPILHINDVMPIIEDQVNELPPEASESAVQLPVQSQEIEPARPYTGASPRFALGQALADNLATYGIPECSVAASDIAKKAHEKFGTKDGGAGSFLVADHEFAPQLTQLEWLGSGMMFVTESGFRASLALTKDATRENSLTLAAITRGNLLFPLVRFSRNNQNYCDFLQFWGEDKMSELESVNMYGWGQDDNGSRFDAVEKVGALLANPNEIERVSELVKILNLDERLKKELGETSQVEETIISLTFATAPKTRDFKMEYTGIEYGKVKDTNFTAEGQLKAVKGYPNRRALSLHVHPTSQASDDWPRKELIIDRLSGISLSAEGEALVPSDLDLKLAYELFFNAMDQVDLAIIKDKEIAATNHSVLKSFDEKRRHELTGEVFKSAGIFSALGIGIEYVTTSKMGISLDTLTLLGLTGVGTAGVRVTTLLGRAGFRAFKEKRKDVNRVPAYEEEEIER